MILFPPSPPLGEGPKHNAATPHRIEATTAYLSPTLFVTHHRASIFFGFSKALCSIFMTLPFGFDFSQIRFDFSQKRVVRKTHITPKDIASTAISPPNRESRGKLSLSRQLRWAALGGRGVRPYGESRDTMKKALLASVALIALGMGVAGAADMPVKAPPPPPLPPPFSWTGCYIGGNIGAAWANSEWHDSLFGLDWGRTSDGRFIGGGQIGCNYQFNNPGFVIGVEGDFDWVGNNNNGRTVGVPVGPRAGDVIQVTSNDTRIATLAARFGYGSDRALFYGKLGAGWIGNDGFTIVDQTTGAAFVGSGSNSVSGWLVGAGIEYAFSPNWSAKLEWDYLKLPGRAFTLTGAVFPALAGDTITSDHNVQMVKLGINYRFGWGGPVVAKY
jgi:outer membrane immunogenic protein